MEKHTFDPSLLFLYSSNPSSRTAIIILNRPFRADGTFQRLWATSSYKICADGGANRLWDAFQDERGYVPNAIVGDMDSIRADVRDRYEQDDTIIIEDGDQYSTDFGKSMDHLRKRIDSLDGENLANNILIVSDLSGRLDQGIGVLHEMLREISKKETKALSLRLWLITDDSISWILPAGENVLLGLGAADAQGTRFFTRNVGILPIYGESKISTWGLEWDVENWETRMGGNVSTSNHIVKDQVVVQTTSAVLFTIERSLAR